ncbi:MAG: hypothetical protein CL928_03940 [Deltaproteobacteria bacterium]|mgnify:CR=1 FL=1|nr:hypothetical protein [Deltaproteobacteria bacterium]
MAAVFTPGLKVAEHAIVHKDRRLPLKGQVTVQVGDTVTADQVVARTELPGKIYPVNLANKLGVDPGRLTEFLLKGEGDKVENGEVIGRTNGFMGFFKAEASAIVTGTIESVSTITGQVIFQADPIPVEIDAYMNGKVVEVVPDEGCVVQSAATFVQGIFGLGGETKGLLTMGVEAPTDRLEASSINESMAGKIIIGGAYLDLAGLQRAIDVGAIGVVTGGFDYDEIKEVLGYEVGVAITGGEDLGLTLIVTEGFGSIQMAPATFDLLKSKVGKRASINGATQIRAGVMRPEVVVTFDEQEVPDELVSAPEPVGISIGDQVRGIRAPYFGSLGKVAGLPVEPVVLDSGSKARVMQVEFENGEVAVLPRANVEAIER